MSYEIKDVNKTIILNVLIGADESLVGLKVNNSTVVSVEYNELHKIVSNVYGAAEYNKFNNALISHHALTSDNSNLIVLETICDGPSDYFEPELILKAFKLYHGADIFSCYNINYCYKDGKLCFGGLGNMLKYTHAIGFIKPEYRLSEPEKTDFEQWYLTAFSKLVDTNCSDSFKAMLRMYDTSYLIGICESEYIMLFTVLEMLFGTEVTKITSHIAKGTSKLIGTTAKEKSYIRDQIYKLYDVRSRYVHDGKNISCEKLFQLREIVRKVLIGIFNNNYHTKDKSLEGLRDSLLSS